MFKPVSPQVSFPQQELDVLQFWKAEGIYEKSLEQREQAPPFIFYEGPPTANGMPHPGHCLTRAIKDLFPRYKTMRGFRCERKAGWDTHGLPVEVEVCKQIGIHSKEEIEEFGIEPFIHKCQQSVWRYMQQWEQLTERLGFWVNLEEAYVTYHRSYVESVWWSLKQLFDRGLLYQGHKIVWWWAQGGTALSSGEVGQGYRTVDDPSVFVLFPLVDQPDTHLLVWTTTPWTLPSNQFAAVHDEIEYATVEDAELGQKVIMAAELVETIAAKLKRELKVVATCSGRQLVGQRYRPPFDNYYQQLGEQLGELRDGGQQHVAWRVTSADFVTTDSGSGIVHEAPAFGEVDYELLLAEQARFVDGQGPQMICAVGPNGVFTDEAPEFAGMWVKDADKPVARALKERGRLYLQEQYRHEYPFCWRADKDPLIQYPRKSWFVRTTQFRDAMLANNRQINWLPEHIRDGRFGNFLESNVDWALSRERYWGTPLPIWVCESTGQMEAIDNYDALLAKPGVSGQQAWEQAKAANPELPDDLCVHKPYIDEVTYDSPFAPGHRMRRVSEVIDCWYDSGAMPFAQWGFPHKNADKFKQQFPADFISEALDQTRGWFYSLLAISTMMFGDTSEQSPAAEGASAEPTEYPHPYRNCIVLGLMLSEWWEAKDDPNRVFLNESDAAAAMGKGKTNHFVGKMSKQKRNYLQPAEIFDRYGADVLRWYFFAQQPPWTSIRYSEQAIKDSVSEFQLRLWNVFSFFVNYANSNDRFEPEQLLDGEVGQLSRQTLLGGRHYRPGSERSELDRWVLSELARTVEQVVQRMDRYDNYGACQVLTGFVDSLSNWYLRRSRDRFWSADPTSVDKLDAYWTLYESLLTTARLVAPFVPFLAETLWQRLTGVFGQRAACSVHLCDYPDPEELAGDIDETLSERMSLLREIASAALAARMENKLKVRQPLASVTVVLGNTAHQNWLEQHDEILKKELNVKSVDYTTDAGQYVTYQVVPNFKRLGPRVGKLMPQVKKQLGDADGGSLLAALNSAGKYELKVADQIVELDNEDIEVRLRANDGWAAAQSRNCVVVLATDLTPELVREGLARDIVRFIQNSRKEMELDFSDRILLNLGTDDEQTRQAVEENRDYICGETLAGELVLLASQEIQVERRFEQAINELPLVLGIQKA